MNERKYRQNPTKECRKRAQNEGKTLTGTCAIAEHNQLFIDGISRFLPVKGYSMLIQLIYMSLATDKFAADDLPAILSKSRLKNKTQNITGMLVYHERVFLQVLEGPSGVVDKLYQRIGADERHHQCDVLARCTIEQRSFGDWSMGFARTDEVRNPESIPGYRDFFESTDPLAHLRQKSGLAQKLLLAFREAELRQAQTEQPVVAV